MLNANLPTLAPGVERCQAAINQYLRRTSTDRMNDIWLALSERERAAWLMLAGGADSVERGVHRWNWSDVPPKIQDVLLERFSKWASRARLIEQVIAGRQDTAVLAAKTN